jgi:isopentenyl diphosphate isomerase/L-lactate dehydrogenase-like FMN-dependent dehydrogenase
LDSADFDLLEERARARLAPSADGVRAVLDHLRAELVRSMALCGAAWLNEIASDLVAKH